RKDRILDRPNETKRSKNERRSACLADEFKHRWLDRHSPPHLTYQQAQEIVAQHGLDQLHRYKLEDQKEAAAKQSSLIEELRLKVAFGEHDSSGLAADYEDKGPTSKTKKW